MAVNQGSTVATMREVQPRILLKTIWQLKKTPDKYEYQCLEGQNFDFEKYTSIRKIKNNSARKHTKNGAEKYKFFFLKSAKLLFQEVHMPIVKQRIKIKSSIQKNLGGTQLLCLGSANSRSTHVNVGKYN
jgi:hypothetical protein